MIKTVLSALFLCYVVVVEAQQDFSTKYPLKWKAKIGLTTYRTNIIEEGGFIYVGSNGAEYNSDQDDLDGVFQINAKTGEIVKTFQAQFLGDNDATGIALKDGKLYFGTDNFFFYCFDVKSGLELWKFQTPYDVESAPVVVDLNNDGKDEVIFCVQNYGMYCLNVEDGSPIWVLDSISSHEGNVSPLVVDCNNDGVLDVVGGFRGTPENDKFAGWKMDHYGDYMLAINGKNGEPLWMQTFGAGIHASPLLYKESGELRIVNVDAYGSLQVMNLKGEVVKEMNFGYGQYMSPVIYKNKLMLNDFIMDFGDELFKKNDRGYNEYLGVDSTDIDMELEGVCSSTTVAADIRGNGKMQFVALSEGGEIGICNEDGTELIKYNFPKGAETTPLIKDIDGDGKLEILIAALDGNLYCYGTGSSGKVHYGQFRCSNSNIPVIK